MFGSASSSRIVGSATSTRWCAHAIASRSLLPMALAEDESSSWPTVKDHRDAAIFDDAMCDIKIAGVRSGVAAELRSFSTYVGLGTLTFF